MFRQKRLGHRKEGQVVFRAGKAVALIRVQDISNRDVLFLHGRHDLIRLRLLDPGVVGPLPNQQRAADVVGVSQRRAGQQKGPPLLRAVIADPAGEQVNLRLPVRGDGVHQGYQVGRADDVHAAGKDFRGESHSDQGRIAAIAAAQDGNPGRVGNALSHGPLHRVQQIIVHLAAPFPVAGVDKALAKAGGAAEVDAQHGVAPVRQQLKDRVIAPFIPRPRAAVDQQGHR